MSSCDDKPKASEKATEAASPFDKSAPGADLVLRSSDSVDFFVSKAVMAIVSPVFRDMFIVAEQTPLSLEHEAWVPP